MVEIEIKLGENVEWEDIELEEVFAADGCIGIFYKISKNKAMLIAVNDKFNNDDIGLIYDFEKYYYKSLKNPESSSFGGRWAVKATTGFFKLDKKIQALWKTE